VIFNISWSTLNPCDARYMSPHNMASWIHCGTKGVSFAIRS